MVKSIAALFSRGDGYPQAFFNLVLSDEFVKAPRPQAGIKVSILYFGLTRYDTLYPSLTPTVSVLVTALTEGSLYGGLPFTTTGSLGPSLSDSNFGCG